MDEAFVTDAVARNLAGAGWSLRSVARPQMGSGALLRPDPEEGRRPERVAGGVVIDIVASNAGIWLFLESKDRFSTDDLRKLQGVRDNPSFDGPLRRLTRDSRQPERLFGLCMPTSEAALEKVAVHAGDLDVFIGVSEEGRCTQLGGAASIFGL